MNFIRNLPAAIVFTYREARNGWRRFWWLAEANRNPDLNPF